MSEETPPSLEERRKTVLNEGYKEVLPSIWTGGPDLLEDGSRFAHMCDEVQVASVYGGLFRDGKCMKCGFTLDEKTQLALKLLDFKG